MWKVTLHVNKRELIFRHYYILIVLFKINFFISLLENNHAKLKSSEAVRTGSSFSMIEVLGSGDLRSPFVPLNNSVLRCNWTWGSCVTSCVVPSQRESVFMHIREREASRRLIPRALGGVTRGPRRVRKTGTSVKHAQAPTHTHIHTYKDRRRDALAVIPARKHRSCGTRRRTPSLSMIHGGS